MKTPIKKQIIAIGGGGFSRYGNYIPSNLHIEKYFITQCRAKCPRICFIPTASGESMKYIADFYRAFGNFDCKPSHLSLFEPPDDLESFILNHDAIYVGGGNTKSMLALWREWKVDIYLKKAWERGIVLGGVSAGALCWFEEGVTDSIPGELTSIKCLGLLSGSFCPHFDSDKKRRPSFHKMIQNGISAGIAADDHVILHYIDNRLEKVLRANSDGNAFRLQKAKGKVKEEKIKPKNICL